MSEAPKNKDLNRLYRAVGEAISSWVYIEWQLNSLFSISLTLTVMQPGGGFSADHRTTEAVLDAIDGFRGRLLMIDAALKGALGPHDPILTDWAIERDKVNKLHWNRNALAHWTAARRLKDDGSVQAAVILPPPFKADQHEGVRETDIDEWAKCFKLAGERLAALVSRLASHKGLQRKFVEQAANQILRALPDDPSLLEVLKHALSDHLKP